MSDIVQTRTVIETEAATSVMGLLKKYSKNFRAVLPKHLEGDRAAMLVMNSIAANPKLAGCTPVSFINCVLQAANLGLEIRKNSAYLIPFGTECQLIIDYHGKMDLARRAGVGAIHVELVREGDKFSYGFDSAGLAFNWTPGESRGEVTNGFVSARIHGEHQVTIMTLDEIEGIRRRAKAGCALDFQHYGKTVKGLTLADIRNLDVATMGFKDPYRQPWVTDWDRMARKTLIHRAANDWPMSPAMLISQEIDDAVEMGVAMPLAPAMALALPAIDPADNRPMVDGGGETREEQQAAAHRVGEEQKALAGKGPPITAKQLARLEQLEGASAAAYKHGYMALKNVRASDYDSIMAMIEAETA